MRATAGGPSPVPASDAGVDGVCIVDKAAGPTSHDVVAQIRRRLGTRRVGHAGTLDPDATGVLVVGVGRATRLLRFLAPLPKSYEAEVVLGVETSTLDASGTTTAVHEMGPITLDQATAAARGLVGDLDQVPPMVSAVKVGGRRLHQLAREGVEVERQARPVTVHRFDVIELLDPPAVAITTAGGARTEEGAVLRVEVDCSSGTYVRVLAADLGRALGGGAHLRQLRRTAIGPFTAARARSVDRLEVLPPLDAVGHLDQVAIGDEVAALVATGTRLQRAGETVAFAGEGPWAVRSERTGELLAVYESAGERASPAVVLVQPDVVRQR
ncbi:MAG TPA: tRNA pseudouridine(55) synthase TruB [Acidimicrobiales bacterium]|nr:tRNA pseudouridine(55) synthase TruB [Acidimicrobiales bacterium]